MHRRNFFALTATAGLAAMPAKATGEERQVIATGDGIPHNPEQYTRLLSKLSIEPDTYSQKGVVETLEKRFAEMLGKEYAIWMPTGTLANHMAVRLLAGDRKRVLVQQDSHLYNDTGDCTETLSGLNLIPLPACTLEAVEQAWSRASTGRVSVPIGAMQIETPVRRASGEMIDFGEMKRICAFLRERKVGLHLDGARLFLGAAYTGVAIKDYASLFDTVYVSMYKYFNAAGGAILAGPRAQLENLFHARRMFGGGIYHSWPYAAVALHYANGFEERFRKAVQTSEAMIAEMQKDNNFELQRVPRGTNIFRFRVRGVNTTIYQQRLDDAGVTARSPESGDWYSLQVNETWLRQSSAEILAAFRKALG